MRTASQDGFQGLSAGDGLCLELAPFRLEKIEDYEYGGHHPVCLGHKLGHDGRYIVVHKLGNGGFTNVWVFRDSRQATPTYVGLKIIMAEASTDDCPEFVQLKLKDLQDLESASSPAFGVCLPLTKFDISGPNGTHYCFVYPLLGPKTSLGLYNGSVNPEDVFQDACFKTFKRWPSCMDVRYVMALSAPQYLVYQVVWYTVDSRFIDSGPSIIDYEEAFPADSPPEDPGIPGPYRSPEPILESKALYGSDRWAMACTLFETRTGRRLINLFNDEDDADLDEMVRLLGPLPEPWWSTTWAERRAHFKDEPDEAVKALTFVEELPYVPPEGVTSSVHPSTAEDARSLVGLLATGVWYVSEEAGRNVQRTHREIPVREKELFADLLEKLMLFKPEDRISASEALGHEWFKM